MNFDATVIQGISSRRTHHTGGMCCCLCLRMNAPMEGEEIRLA